MNTIVRRVKKVDYWSWSGGKPTVVIRNIANFKAKDVARVAVRALKPFKSMIYTITLDNGKGFDRHRIFAKALGAQTYFCRPCHS